MTAKVYIAGPMRGIKDFNFDAFYAAEKEVHDLLGDCPFDEPFEPSGTYRNAAPGTGRCTIVIFNPARRDHELYGPDVNKSETGDLSDLPSFDLREALGADLNWIAREATHIYMLDGWENSSGARAEKALAEALGLTVLYQSKAVTPGSPEDWAEFWEDTTGTEIQHRGDSDCPWCDGSCGTERVSLDELFGPYANAVRKADAMREEVRTVSSTGGEKGMKQAQIGAIDPQSLLRLAEVAGFGARKYARLNYMNGFDWSLAFDAAQRHLLEFWNGTDRDPESGLPHLAHAAWQCLALLTFMERGLGADDRYSSTV